MPVLIEHYPRRMIISIIEKKPQLWSYIIRNSVGAPLSVVSNVLPNAFSLRLGEGQKMPTDEFVQMMEASFAWHGVIPRTPGPGTEHMARGKLKVTIRGRRPTADAHEVASSFFTWSQLS